MRLVLVMLLALALMASSAHAGRSKVKKEPSSCTQDFAFSSTESADAFLASVLNPISVEDFFTHHFQQKAASAQRPKMPTYYGRMTSFDDVQYALENGYGSNPNQRLVYGKDWKLAKRVFRDGDYWTGLYKGESAELGVEEAMSAVSSGFTVIMNGVQSSLPNVYQGAWQLETALGWHVNVNLYISPPGGAQGFEAHLDWMDGFIFQITGKKRWKVYEPALVSYPRPDLVRKPTLSFLDEAGGMSTESDLVMKAGDFAYIPRGIVHQAHTAREDITSSHGEAGEGEGEEAESPIYQQASMHLTFGLELAKDASVEMLLHHFISKQPPAVFDTLSESLQALSLSNSSSLFESDNGKVSFECTSSSGAMDSTSSASGGIQSSAAGVEDASISSSPAPPTRCTERDLVHLLLSAMAGFISTNETAFLEEENETEEKTAEDYILEQDMEVDMDISTAVLRKAVGVTARTSALPSLDPRLLLPHGLEVFSHAIQRLGVRQLFRFLLEKQMVTVTVAQQRGVCAEDNSDGSDSSDSLEIRSETLYPTSGSGQSYTTLGSDFSCKYINSFFSQSFKTEGAGRLALQLQVSNQSHWEDLVLGAGGTSASQTTVKEEGQEQGASRSYDREALESFLSQDSWQRVENVLSEFVGLMLRSAEESPRYSSTDTDIDSAGSGERREERGEREEEIKTSSSRRKKRQHRHGTSYVESEVYCDAWKSMMETMAADKRIRKKAGHAALQNAGYQMNVS